MNLCRSQCFVALFMLLAGQSVVAYDFTNVQATRTALASSATAADQRTDTIRDRTAPASSSSALRTKAPVPGREEHAMTSAPVEHLGVSKAPAQWFLSHIYAHNNSVSPSADINTATAKSPKSSDIFQDDFFDDDDDDLEEKVETEKRQRTQIQQELVDEAEEAVKYNVSSLGLKDPFAHYATKLTYDYAIDIGEPLDNRHGSILSMLNGTIHPLGSVGAMMALGWAGGTNHSKVVETAAAAPQPHSSAADGDEHHRTNKTHHRSTASSVHHDGLSGVWLAFTSKDAVTGGYTLHANKVSATNNILFRNVTFRSNFTIDAHGKFTFTFSVGTVDESDQLKKKAAAGEHKQQGAPKPAASLQSLGTTAEELNISPGSPLEGRLRKEREQREKEAFSSEQKESDGTEGSQSRRGNNGDPIQIDGPHCQEMKAATNNSETIFRMRCQGSKVKMEDL